jgi:AbrB family looped-hinge helix DNA binding protein
MSSASLSSKGQLTIPAEVRADLQLHAGDRVSFERAEDGSYRIRAVKRDIMRLAGILKHDGPPVSVEAMNAAIADAAAERFRRKTS